MVNNEKEYSIEISPEILELLGPSLYTNIYYVLAELIANAYDADAHNVYIIEKDDCIIVEDDGQGMSYKEGVKKYLQVAKTTRTSSEDDLTLLGRRKMGRKGIGKLAALSVSENVKVMTKTNDTDISGFVLSRTISEDNKLEPIAQNEIAFEKISTNGTSIVMLDPEYSLHKTLQAQKRNLTRMFPVVNDDFRIHLHAKTGDEDTVGSFEDGIIPQLSTLITIGNDFQGLQEKFSPDYEDMRRQVAQHLSSDLLSTTITMNNKAGEETDCEIVINGWIGTYKTTTNRKKEANDFPDNFLSVFANGKLGQFNIIPEISQNRLSESYVVGQLHIDAFEITNLPDMALSNRQGYKFDDPRYQAALEIIRPQLFNKILNMRDRYTDRKRDERDKKKNEIAKKNEQELKRKTKEFSDKLAKDLGKDPNDIHDTARKVVNEHLSLFGLKSTVDSNKKKLLISHASEDIILAQLIYDLLIMNGVSPEEIIFTSSENEKSRIPEGRPIYDYLREFFVESQSSQMINVIFITSEVSSKKWNPVCEVGAAWITKADHKIFTIGNHSPEEPLDKRPEWHRCKIENDEIHMNKREADIFKVKIRTICESLDVNPHSDEIIMKQILDRVVIDA